VTNLALFATGRFNGDGRQGSHWKDGLAIGLMDPTLAPGELAILSALDLRALDAIGWDLATPEPGTITLVLSGLLSAIAFRTRLSKG
jgi:hypothetical protein